jgi:hypothetical protein
MQNLTRQPRLDKNRGASLKQFTLLQISIRISTSYDCGQWDAAYRSMDANGDGVVSQGEFAAAMGGGRR